MGMVAGTDCCGCRNIFASLGVIASMEPPHAVEDKAWAEDRLGAERIRGAYAWRTLREAGVVESGRRSIVIHDPAELARRAYAPQP